MKDLSNMFKDPKFKCKCPECNREIKEGQEYRGYKNVFRCKCGSLITK